MGHDIVAYRPFVDAEALREKYRLDDMGNDWVERYDKYCNETQIAYNRRSAGNPLNQVLYLALGVMEDAYAGCSGNGETLNISLDQFKNGLEVLRNKQFVGMKRDRNLGDEVFETLAKLADSISLPPEMVSEDGDVSQEIDFISKCIEFLEKNNQPSLRVSFG